MTYICCYFLQNQCSEFFKSYENKVRERFRDQNSPKLTDSEIRKIERAVMMLLRRHNAEGQLSCVDEDHLKVVDVDANGFVTVVKCTNKNCTRRNELMETTCHDVNWTYEKNIRQIAPQKGRSYLLAQAVRHLASCYCYEGGRDRCSLHSLF